MVLEIIQGSSHRTRRIDPGRHERNQADQGHGDTGQHQIEVSRGQYLRLVVNALGQAGVKRVDVVCPGFTSDCLETLEEINMEAREAFLHAGGEGFSYIPCLNSNPVWLDALTDLTEQHLQGWPTRSSVEPQELQAARERALAMGATN